MVSGMDPGPSSLLALLGTMVNGIPVLLLLLKGSRRWSPGWVVVIVVVVVAVVVCTWTQTTEGIP